MKQTRLVLPILLIFVLLFSTPVFAQTGTTDTQAPGTWVSSINVQNTGTSDATVTLTFYDPAGTEMLSYQVTPKIPVNGSRSLYVPTEMSTLANGQYSAIVSSDQPLEVVVNSSSTTPSTAGSYSGFKNDEIAKTLYFPGLYNSYYTFDSEIIIQNTNSSSANLTISFFDQATGTEITAAELTESIGGYSTKVFALSDISNLPSGAAGLFSASVTSDQDIAGIVNIWSPTMYGEYATYNGFKSGSTSVIYAPALYNNYYDFVSALTIQNLGTNNADIRVTYSNGTVENKTLAPFQAFQYYQPNKVGLPTGNANGVFSAKIESLDNEPIVALVNIENKKNGLLASYNGPSAATASTNCAVVMKSYYEWFSAQTVQNVGNAPTTITITYADGKTREFPNVPANGTVNIVELDSAGSVLPNVSSLSAVISSDGQPIVAVVQENSNGRYAATPGDYLLSYTCVAQQ